MMLVQDIRNISLADEETDASMGLVLLLDGLDEASSRPWGYERQKLAGPHRLFVFHADGQSWQIAVVVPGSCSLWFFPFQTQVGPLNSPQGLILPHSERTQIVSQMSMQL